MSETTNATQPCDMCKTPVAEGDDCGDPGEWLCCDCYLEQEHRHPKTGEALYSSTNATQLCDMCGKRDATHRSSHNGTLSPMLYCLRCAEVTVISLRHLDAGWAVVAMGA